jgi:peptidoglycan/LPS O-acetylase OafA/YrhL
MAADSSGASKSRVAYIDGLRAIAVLSVVVHHAAKYDAGIGSGPLQHAFLEGAHGVDLFFVISGLCLSYPVLAALRDRGWASFDVPGYFARRVVRIVPPYYFAIAVVGTATLALAHWGIAMPHGVSGSNVTWFEVIKQMIFADRRPQFLNGSFWSLAVEWRWYFLFPVMLLLWTRSARAFVALTIAIGAVAALTRAGGFDLPILPAFMLGIVAAQAEIASWPVRRLAALLFVLALCVALALEPKFSSEFFRQDQPAWQVAAFFFVVAAGSVPWLRAALSLRPLIWVGVASYSIYLVHEPIIALAEQSAGLNAALAGFAAIACGGVFWCAFERPFTSTRLKRQMVFSLRSWTAMLAALVGAPELVNMRRALGDALTTSEVAHDQDEVLATYGPASRL